MNYNNFKFLLILSVFFIFSCSDKDNTEPVVEEPTTPQFLPASERLLYIQIQPL